jgi:hypothetical protein
MEAPQMAPPLSNKPETTQRPGGLFRRIFGE